ncbi:MAG: hypothetical protein E5W89_32380 [Mesorhizobium sp.]|nr:MAG: hypothetical protein E5W89_32380 [Mesorhizobium sp.]
MSEGVRSGVADAVAAGLKKLDRLALAKGQLERRLRKRRKNSSLPALIELVLARPSPSPTNSQNSWNVMAALAVGPLRVSSRQILIATTRTRHPRSSGFQREEEGRRRRGGVGVPGIGAGRAALGSTARR